MNGFLLSVNRGRREPIDFRIISNWHKAITGGPLERHTFHVSSQNPIQDGHSYMHRAMSMGVIRYGELWHQTALESIASNLRAGMSLSNIAPKCRGQFCLIVHTPHEVQVITDRLGTLPIYMVEGPDRIEMSNSLLLLAKNNKVTVDRQSLAEIVNLGYCLDATLFQEIRRLDMARVYRISSEGIACQKYDDVFADIAFDRYQTLEQAASLAKEMLLENLAFLKSAGRVFVDITGGFDTRMAAAFLKAQGTDFEAGICGEQVLGEIELARQVADALGKPLHCDIAISDRSGFDEILRQHYAITTGVPILYQATELINYYNTIAREFDIHVTGFGGSEVMEQTLPKMRLFSSKVSHRGICMRKEWLYKDVFRDSVMTQAEFYSNLSAKLDRLIGRIGSNLYHRVGNALSVLDFSRNYAGCLMGTHNAIMPVYTPFLEGNYVRLMLETSYKLKRHHLLQRWILSEVNQEVSRIMTSHGYTASMTDGGPGVAMKAREWCKDRARQVLYGTGLYGSKEWAARIAYALRPRKQPEQIHRRFWVEAVDQAWSWDMPIFDWLDRDRLSRALPRDPQAAKTKALVLYLNRIMDDSKCVW